MEAILFGKGGFAHVLIMENSKKPAIGGGFQRGPRLVFARPPIGSGGGPWENESTSGGRLQA